MQQQQRCTPISLGTRYRLPAGLPHHSATFPRPALPPADQPRLPSAVLLGNRCVAANCLPVDAQGAAVPRHVLCRICQVHCAQACRRLPEWWTILPPAAGPYKGGLRFRPGVNLSIIKFLVSHHLRATVQASSWEEAVFALQLHLQPSPPSTALPRTCCPRCHEANAMKTCAHADVACQLHLMASNTDCAGL